MRTRLLLLISVLALPASPALAQSGPAVSGTEAIAPRERINIDRDWTFALGDAHDPERDFGYGTAPFFFAKAGYGDGPASPKFDDRAWRHLDLPHDWGVEVPFDARADGNHGSRAIGPGFPGNDIGWYRKTIDIPSTDQGRRIAVEFDGVFRDAVVWFNGHYIGEEHSGYSGTRYDLTDYVNYGGPNTLVVRVNVSTFEGWFYEGAGIYRHVWLSKTDPLHVGQWGTFVTTRQRGADATVTARATIDNDDVSPKDFTVEQEILAPDGRRVALSSGPPQQLGAGKSLDTSVDLALPSAQLWSTDTPTLYTLVTSVRENGVLRDRYRTSFGVRDIRWDPRTGFWLNGRNLKLKGLNNHQDHAGVGVALSDGMQVYRLERLKAMGANAYRASHGPPTPELLDAADRLGLLVIDEHRMMGTTPEVSDQLERLIRRDRNHPSVALWSVGNEEWAIEGNALGARLTKLMQARVHALDPSRATTVATAGGDAHGSATTTEVAGFNYRMQHDVDGFHRRYPDTPIVMTEEGSTFATRGMYQDDPDRMHLAAFDKEARPGLSSSIEDGWKAVVARPYVAGMFVWTGFDYRGETTPFGWPAISSQFGMLDTTGAFKDSAWYLKTQWVSQPLVHIVGQWNRPAALGELVPIWVYANVDSVDLTLNGRSLGRQAVPRNGHVEWKVRYAPGKLVARGYRTGKLVTSDAIQTTGAARRVQLSVDTPALPGTAPDIAVINVSVVDAHGRVVPTAANDIAFDLSGAEILGVGNGDPASHEQDRFSPSYLVTPLGKWELANLPVGTAQIDRAVATGLSWRDPFKWYAPGTGPAEPDAFVVRGRVEPLKPQQSGRQTLFLPRLAPNQQVFIDGRDKTAEIKADDLGGRLVLDGTPKEILIIVPTEAAVALKRLRDFGLEGRNVAFLQTVAPAPAWHRRLFNGHAQVIVSMPAAGEIARLTAAGEGLQRATATLGRPDVH